MKITIKRETDDIFTCISDTPFWDDGKCINERVAFNARGNLSNIKAQAIDRENGRKYLIISPFGISRKDILDAARLLPVGRYFDYLS